MRVWLIREDFPEPETPVIATSLFKGISTLILFKLLVFASEIYMELLLSFLSIFSSEMTYSFLKYSAVTDSFEAAIFLSGPSATIDPP